MKYKIIADSSCDVKNDYLKDKDIPFEVVPLIINIGEQQFVDDDNVDVSSLLGALKSSFSSHFIKSSTACPSPGRFLEACSADNNFIITISGKLSGTFNSAMVAKNSADGKNIHVIDSKSTSVNLTLIINELVRLIESGLEYEEICQRIDEFNENSQLLFVLGKFDNLVKNGRMSKLTSILATALHIKPLCEASEGEIKIIEKPRTQNAALKRLCATIGVKTSVTKGKECLISYCVNLDLAKQMKQMIEEAYEFDRIEIIPMRGLCSYYSLENSIIVSFEK